MMFLCMPDNLPSYVALSLTRNPDLDFSSWVLVVKRWENYALVEDREVRYAMSVFARQEFAQRSSPTSWSSPRNPAQQNQHLDEDLVRIAACAAAHHHVGSIRCPARSSLTAMPLAGPDCLQP